MKKLVTLFIIVLFSLVGLIVYKTVDNSISNPSIDDLPTITVPGEDNEVDNTKPSEDNKVDNTNCKHEIVDGKCNVCGRTFYLGELTEETLILTTPSGETLNEQEYLIEEGLSYLFRYNLPKEFTKNFDFTYEISGTVDLLMSRYENNEKVDEFETPKTIDVSKFTNNADIGFSDGLDIKYEATNLLRFVEPQNYIRVVSVGNSNDIDVICKTFTNNLFNTEDGTENYNGSTNPENGVKVVLVGCDLTIRVTFTEVISGLSTYVDFKLES